MKPRRRHVYRVVILGLAVYLLASDVAGQSPAELTVQTYAGLTIAGTVGASYSIEYVTNLAQADTPSAWRPLEMVALPTSPYLWIDKSAPATEERFYRAVTTPQRTDLVYVAPGTFRMGSPVDELNRESNEGPQMDVTITRGFWMAKHEVTQGEYLAVVGSNPSWFNGVRLNYPSIGTVSDYGTDLTRPVEQVTWVEATNYCSQLTQRERAESRIPSNYVYRLPTEAEWEYACRAGTTTRFSCGDDLDDTNLKNYDWYNGQISGTTHPVGQKLPNPWGLYDMHGNVNEWCQDWYASYPGGVAVDPQGPARTTGEPPLGAAYWGRVYRSGSWASEARYCRSAHRNYHYPALGNNFRGFRVVLAPDQP